MVFRTRHHPQRGLAVHPRIRHVVDGGSDAIDGGNHNSFIDRLHRTIDPPVCRDIVIIYPVFRAHFKISSTRLVSVSAQQATVRYLTCGANGVCCVNYTLNAHSL